MEGGKVAERTCSKCGKTYTRQSSKCGPCLTKERQYRACPECGKMHRKDGVLCYGCARRRNAPTKLEPYRIVLKRPPDGWPVGHFETLTARAERELPLFG